LQKQAFFEVHGILGTGFLGKVYQRAMQVDLKKVEFKRVADSGESASHPRPKGIAHKQTLEVTLSGAPQFIDAVSFFGVRDAG